MRCYVLILVRGLVQGAALTSHVLPGPLRPVRKAAVGPGSAAAALAV